MSKRRLTLTIREDVYELLKKTSEAQNETMTTVANNLIEGMAPVLEAMLPEYEKARKMSDEAMEQMRLAEEQANNLLNTVMGQLREQK